MVRALDRAPAYHADAEEARHCRHWRFAGSAPTAAERLGNQPRGTQVGAGRSPGPTWVARRLHCRVRRHRGRDEAAIAALPLAGSMASTAAFADSGLGSLHTNSA
jgi:hypothetical protein